MGENGRLSASDLATIPGGRLRKDAAAAWLALRRKIGNEQGVWICPTSTRTAYRSFADQEYFWRLYQQGGNLAARPGTSNHGWGMAVDVPQPAMKAALRAHGHDFGWGIAGGRLSSDAPSEDWHSLFHTGVWKGHAEPEHVHPYHVMNDRERAARDVLVKERRVAKKHGGWANVDHIHTKRAMKAKATLRRCARDIAAAARESGWDRANRRARFDYINRLTGAGDEEGVAVDAPIDPAELPDEPNPPFGEIDDYVYMATEIDEEEGVAEALPLDAGAELADGPDPAFGETDDEELELPGAGEPEPDPADDGG